MQQNSLIEVAHQLRGEVEVGAEAEDEEGREDEYDVEGEREEEEKKKNNKRREIWGKAIAANNKQIREKSSLDVLTSSLH